MTDLGIVRRANLDADLRYSPIRVTQSRTCYYLGTCEPQMPEHGKPNNVPVIKVKTVEETHLANGIEKQENPTISGKRMGSKHAKQYSLWVQE